MFVNYRCAVILRLTVLAAIATAGENLPSIPLSSHRSAVLDVWDAAVAQEVAHAALDILNSATTAGDDVMQATAFLGVWQPFQQTDATVATGVQAGDVGGSQAGVAAQKPVWMQLQLQKVPTVEDYDYVMRHPGLGERMLAQVEARLQRARTAALVTAGGSAPGGDRATVDNAEVKRRAWGSCGGIWRYIGSMPKEGAQQLQSQVHQLLEDIKVGRDESGDGSIAAQMYEQHSQSQESWYESALMQLGVKFGCSNVDCYGLGPDINARVCAGCRRVWYCGVPCQRQAWARHKTLCKAAEAAEEGE